MHFYLFLCTLNEQALKILEQRLSGLKILSSSSSTGFANQDLSQPAITCSKLTIETLEQGVK